MAFGKRNLVRPLASVPMQRSGKSEVLSIRSGADFRSFIGLSESVAMIFINLFLKKLSPKGNMLLIPRTGTNRLEASSAVKAESTTTETEH
jgi:hypothetical protein